MANPIARPRHSYSLQVHLSTIFLSLVIAVGIALGTLAYRYAVNLVDTSTDAVLERVTRYSVARTESLFSPAESVAHLLSSSVILSSRGFTERVRGMQIMLQGLERAPSITSVYVANGEGDFMLVRRLPDDPALAARFNAPPGTAYVMQSIERIADQEPVGMFIYIGSSRRVLGVEDRPDYVDFDPRSRPWYNTARDQNGAITTAPYVFFTTREIGTTIARRSAASVPGPYYVVGVDITLKTLSTAMIENRVTPGSESVLMTKEGLIAAHANPDQVMYTLENGDMKQRHVSEIDMPILSLGFERFRAGAGERQSLILNGAEWEVAFGAVPLVGGEDLILGIAIPRIEMMASVFSLLREGGLWFVGLLLLSAIAVFWVSREVTRPIRGLQHQAEAVRRFDFSPGNHVRTRISDIQDLGIAVTMMQETIRRFLEISNAVAAEEDFDSLMRRLLDEIIGTTQTEAGILYLTSDDGARLVPHAARLDHYRDLEIPLSDVLLSRKRALIVRTTVDELAEGATATETELDMMGLTGIGQAMDEIPRNLVAAPLFNRQKELVGVLLLIESDHTMDPALVRFTEALSGSAAVSLEARQLIAVQKELFESFIRIIAGAIDAKSPYTGGHCARVPELTKMLAAAADRAEDGPFGDFKLTTEDWEAIHVAAWLHDCGKVTTPEFVVDKATKLETIYDRIHEIRMRIEVMKREAEIDYLRDALRHGETPERQSELAATLAQLDDDFAFLADCNPGGEFMSDDRIARIRALAEKTWTRTLDDRLGISHAELERMERREHIKPPVLEPLLADRVEHLFPRPESEKLEEKNPWGFKMDVPELLYNRGEVHNLCIRRGTLTDEDRYKINEHIVQTIKMLDHLPFPKHLKHVPELAGGHHEKMDGTGYPKRLSKKDMSPVARMMAIADIFEALTAIDRPYKKGKTLAEALKIMTFMVKDQHIDPDLFDLFLTSGIYKDYAEKYLKPEQIDAGDPEEYRVRPPAAE